MRVFIKNRCLKVRCVAGLGIQPVSGDVWAPCLGGRPSLAVFEGFPADEEERPTEFGRGHTSARDLRRN
jgi:hypothetical protein